MTTFIKKEISDNPKATPYSVERNLLQKNQGSVSIFAKSRDISDIFKEAHKEIKLSDIGLLKKARTKEQGSFFKKFVINEKFQICLFSSDLMLQHLKKNISQLFIDGHFKIPKLFYQLVTIYMYDDSIDFYSPCIFALIDFKKEIYYNSMYIEIKNLLNELSNELKIELNLKAKYRVVHEV